MSKAYKVLITPDYYENSQSKLKKSLLLDGFRDYSTLHGLPRILQERGVIKRVVWLILTIAATAWWIYHSYLLVNEYFNYETNTKLSIAEGKELSFPAVTICNANPLRKGAVDANFWVTLNNSGADDIVRNNKSLDKNYQKEQEIQEYLTTITEEKKMSWGYNYKNFILQCNFNGYPCKRQDFKKFYNNKFGNCYLFSGETSTTAGFHSGLQLRVNIDQDEYIRELGHRAGVRITVTEQVRMPFPEADGILAAPGTETAIGLRMKQYSRLGGNYGECISSQKKDSSLDAYIAKYNWTEYSYRGCQRTCFQLLLEKTCTCFDNKYPPVNKSLKPCSIKKEKDRECNGNVEESFKKTGCANCLILCSNSEYAMTVSTSKWPSRAYEQTLFEELKATNSRASQIITKGPGEASHNFLEIRVFFESLNFEIYEQIPKVEMEEFLSDLGGAVGLWLGASVLTLFEFFEIMFDFLYLTIIRR